MLYNKKGISGSTLKLIAIVTMLIDHLGYSFFTDMPILRMIGRTAFPIFAFMLVEGFVHTHDREKYAFRLARFAVLSELPFNLLIFGNTFELWILKQNVIFTMLIAFLTIWGLERVRTIWSNHTSYMLCVAGIAAAGALVAQLFRTDYSIAGVLTIVTMYLLRDNRMMQVLLGCLVLSTDGSREWYCIFAAIPLLLYNGRKGLPLKYVFYVFYPLHMLIIALIRLYFFQS